MKPTKHFCCTICQRGFTRIDHLKRHHLRHSGLKPYSCVFCDVSFARCDNLRDHYGDCVKRGDREIPETGQRGRRRHACQSCTSMKLRCDGESPCGSCAKRNLECNKDRKRPTASPGASSDTPSMKQEDYDRPSDRGSIKFLLNGGTDSFTEDFLLPPRSDRTRGLEYHQQKEEADNSMLALEPQGGHTNFAPGFVEVDPTRSLSFFQDTFLDFFNGPFGEIHKSLVDPYPGQMVDYPAILPTDQHPNLALSGQQPFEPEKPFATAMIQAILSRAWSVPLDAKVHEEISTNLTFLLTTVRIQKFIALYFKYWHANCAIVHAPSFDPDAVALPLLTSIVFMGAMYTKDERELYVAKRLLDFAELYIFSTDIFSYEYEVAATICGGRNLEEAHDWIQFQGFQAGFLMVVAQYWAGGRISSSRAMENRFSEVVKVARRIGLVRYQHTPEDGIDEIIWIQNECRIRNMNIVSLLDCAFSFYQNYPCRLSHTELQWDFPCFDSVFASEHPFAEPDFQVSRGITVEDAFSSLFEETSGLGIPNSPPLDAIAHLTVLDMFVLIHVLYAFINTHMTCLAPLMRTAYSPINKPSVGSSGSGKRRQSVAQEDSTLIPIRMALTRWREHWLTLRNTLSSHAWASMGFYKNGYNFWLVSHLLITKKESVDVVMKMEVRCEDKLEKLKVLLEDENDE
ncbi:hypothetical protein BDW59DRAFT_23510 [Aspergillus cavernicola]|uniref:C2H2 finger domain protein n=1 Tax=Aspergillus cavernicola TaxID=176166 RepID=A0ABR4ITV3_9EURO